MSLPVHNLIRSATRQNGDPLNIMWIPYNGSFEKILFETMPHRFYVSHDIECMPWDTVMFPKPDNCITLEKHNSFSLDTEFDAIVCNGRFAQLERAKVMSDVLHIPIVLVEHFLPVPAMKKEDIQLMKDKIPAHQTVMSHNLINMQWNTSYPVIPYGIPDLYDDTVEKEDQIVLIGNFNEKDQVTLNRLVSQSKYKVVILGNQKHSYQDLCSTLQRSKFIINLQTTTTMSLNILLAMSAGCVPLTNDGEFATGLTPYIFNSQETMMTAVANTKYLQEDVDRGREIIATKFSMDNFTSRWNEIFSIITNLPYIRI